MEVEDKFNTEVFANEVFKEMKGDGNEFGSFDNYWHRIRMSLQSRGVEAPEVSILENLVKNKVEELFEKKV